MRESSWYIQPGYTGGKSSHHAFLHVERRIPIGDGLDSQHRPIAYYELQFNEDNGEVQLVKYVGAKEGDEGEIVYSELLDTGEETKLSDMSKNELAARAIQMGGNPTWATAVTRASLIEWIEKHQL